jgi:hypothetical protein
VEEKASILLILFDHPQCTHYTLYSPHPILITPYTHYTLYSLHPILSTPYTHYTLYSLSTLSILQAIMLFTLFDFNGNGDMSRDEMVVMLNCVVPGTVPYNTLDSTA